MKKTIRIDQSIHRRAKAAARSRGVTLTQFVAESVLAMLTGRLVANVSPAQVEDRIKLMDSLLQRTSHFKVGPIPTREEMNDRSGSR